MALFETGDSPLELDRSINPAAEMKALKKELKKLRRGREQLAMRAKKARRELAQTRKRQKEVERKYLDQQEIVAAISKRLGCPAEGLPEIDEWRELAKAHDVREKELQRQIVEEQAAHEAYVEELRAELSSGGRPNTEKAKEADENKARRLIADERCCQIQAIRDYLQGDLQFSSQEELWEVIRPSPEAEEDRLASRATAVEDGDGPPLEAYEELIEAVHQEVLAKHEENLRDLVQLSNVVMGRKDLHLKTLGYSVLSRGLEDTKLCTPAERNSLRELLNDVESICAWRLQQGSDKNAIF